MTRDIEPVDPSGGLTPMQQVFIECKLAGKTIQEAAELAGYAHPHTAGHTVMRNPAVQRAIEAATRTGLRYDMGPRALQTLDKIASDDDTNARVRVAASKALAELSGLGISHNHENGSQKDLAEMTAEDIALAMSKLESLLASKARDVTPDTRQTAPGSPPIEAQAIDLLD